MDSVQKEIPQCDWSYELNNRVNRRIHLLASKQQKDSWFSGFQNYQEHSEYYTESCLELFLDHSIIIITVNSKVMTKSKLCSLHNTKTNWPNFQELLMITLHNSIPLKTDDVIICIVESFNHAV